MPAGRPTLLNDLVAKRICEALATGQTRRCAAALGGVEHRTLCYWLAKGRKGDPKYRQFVHQIEKAEAEAEAPMVERVRQGTVGWQGAAWWLERRRRKTWKRPAFQAAEQPKPRAVGLVIDADLAAMTDEQVEAEIERLRNSDPQRRRDRGGSA